MFYQKASLFSAALLLAAAANFVSGPLRAGDVYEGEARFARAQKVEGAVTVGHAFENDFVELQPNEALGEGDKLQLPDGARIAVNLGGGARLLADGPAQIELLRLSPGKAAEIRLHEGRVIVESTGRVIRIETPRGDASLSGEGRLMVSRTAADGAVEVSALRGKANAGADENEQALREGESLLLGEEDAAPQPLALQPDGALLSWAAPERPAAAPTANSPEDEAFDRDDAPHDAAGARDSLPRELRDDGDFNAYGRWRYIDGDGWVWRPWHVEPDWMPYSVGFWRHTPWGLFWVSAEPWGWGPYRWGGWRFDPLFGWIWIPHHRFGGAWVVFNNDGDDWGWCPAWWHHGRWWPGHRYYIRVNVRHFYDHHRRFDISPRPSHAIFRRLPQLPRPQPIPMPRPGPAPRPGPRPNPHPGGAPRPQPMPRPGPGPRPAPRLNPRPGGEPRLHPQPMPRPGPAPRPGPRPNPRPGPEPRPQPHPQPMPRPGSGTHATPRDPQPRGEARHASPAARSEGRHADSPRRSRGR